MFFYVKSCRKAVKVEKDTAATTIGSANGVEDTEPANAPDVTESTEAVSEPAEQETTDTVMETPKEAKTELEEAKSESDNPLTNVEIQIADVMNGTGMFTFVRFRLHFVNIRDCMFIR